MDYDKRLHVPPPVLKPPRGNSNTLSHRRSPHMHSFGGDTYVPPSVSSSRRNVSFAVPPSSSVDQMQQQQIIMNSGVNSSKGDFTKKELTDYMLTIKEKYLGDFGSSIFMSKEQEGQAIFCLTLVMFFICVKSFAGSLSPLVLAGVLYLASKNFKGMASKLGIGLGKEEDEELQPQSVELDERGNRTDIKAQKSALNEAIDDLNRAHQRTSTSTQKFRNGFSEEISNTPAKATLADEFRHHRRQEVTEVPGESDHEIPGKVGRGLAARARRDRKRRIMRVQIKTRDDPINPDNMIIR